MPTPLQEGDPKYKLLTRGLFPGKKYCSLNYTTPSGGGTGACVSLLPDHLCPIKQGSERLGGRELLDKCEYTETKIIEALQGLSVAIEPHERLLLIKCLTPPKELTNPFEATRPGTIVHKYERDGILIFERVG